LLPMFGSTCNLREVASCWQFPDPAREPLPSGASHLDGLIYKGLFKLGKEQERESLRIMPDERGRNEHDRKFHRASRALPGARMQRADLFDIRQMKIAGADAHGLVKAVPPGACQTLLPLAVSQSIHH
jgi:hypothetical protein